MTRTLAPVFTPSPSPTITVLEIATGGVVCDIRLHMAKRDTATAIYDVALANATDVDVSCRLIATDFGGANELDLGEIEIARLSVGRSRFIVPADERRPPERIFVQITGEGLSLRSEARLPPLPRKRSFPVASIFLGIAIAGTSLLSAAAYGRPTIALAVARDVRPGTIHATYALHASTRTRYRAYADDGTTIAQGIVTGSSGDLAIPLPANAAGKHYRIGLDATGPFGRASAESEINVGAVSQRPVPSDARIISLSAHREIYDGQTSLIVSYLAIADGGNVTVLDARGASIATAPFTHGGTTRISLPESTSMHELRAVLHVGREKTNATSTVEVPPESVPAPNRATSPRDAIVAGSPLPPILPPEAILPNADERTTASAGDPFTVNTRVVGGIGVDITIVRRLPQMRLALEDEMGTTLDERDVSDDARTVRLSVPRVSHIEVYYVTCTFVRASSQETIVRSLRVFPR